MEYPQVKLWQGGDQVVEGVGLDGLVPGPYLVVAEYVELQGICLRQAMVFSVMDVPYPLLNLGPGRQEA